MSIAMVILCGNPEQTGEYQLLSEVFIIYYGTTLVLIDITSLIAHLDDEIGHISNIRFCSPLFIKHTENHLSFFVAHALA